MKLYTKPVVSIDSGLAEGVYAASGAASIPVSSPKVVADWGNSGQVEFTIDLSNVNSSQLTVVMTFNMEISNGWGGGANASNSGNQLTLYWYSAPNSADITVQVNSAVNQLKCTGTTYSNAANS